MARLMQTLERRRNAKMHLTEHHTEPLGDHEKEVQPEKAMSELFPNGERMQVIRAIKALQRENEKRRDQYLDLRAIVEEIAARLKIPV